jgi:CRISPR-associated endonuclease/helicase Cas3
MHVVFISNCELKALPKTRALLDRYASRIGDRAWLTLITQAALDEVHAASRKIATRQTSIACYRNDSVLGMRLLWVVGNKSSYDRHGRFAVSTQMRAKMTMPPYLRLAALVAQLAGYVHDLGKLTTRFQSKLNHSMSLNDSKKSTTNPPQNPVKDYIRHEWISAWIMKRLQDGKQLDAEFIREIFSDWYNERSRYFPAVNQPTPLDQRIDTGMSAMRWVVATHHGAVSGKIGTGTIDCARHVRTPTNSILERENLTLMGTGSFDPFTSDSKDAERWSDLFVRINKLIARISAIQRDPLSWEGVMIVKYAVIWKKTILQATTQKKSRLLIRKRKPMAQDSRLNDFWTNHCPGTYLKLGTEHRNIYELLVGTSSHRSTLFWWMHYSSTERTINQRTPGKIVLPMRLQS